MIEPSIVPTICAAWKSYRGHGPPKVKDRGLARRTSWVGSYGWLGGEMESRPDTKENLNCRPSSRPPNHFSEPAREAYRVMVAVETWVCRMEATRRAGRLSDHQVICDYFLKI